MQQNWGITTQAFIGDDNGQLQALRTVQVEWTEVDGQLTCQEVPGTEQEWPCDLVLLAMGFTGTQVDLAEDLHLGRNQRDLFAANDVTYQIQDKWFAAGDCRRGQSLIVWAIAEGRELARQVDHFLMGSSTLPSKGAGDLLKP